MHINVILINDEPDVERKRKESISYSKITTHLYSVAILFSKSKALLNTF